MSRTDTNRDPAVCTRKEPRFKTSQDKPLLCETTMAQAALRRGTVVDISTSGVRLLCEGAFEPGQQIFTELTTDRSHGIYRGVIRRVEPWVGGQSVLGCSLEDPIPQEVLQELAMDGAVNRRSEHRVDVHQDAKLSWPLSREEVDVELQDFSMGGLKIAASTPIPNSVRLRFRVNSDQDNECVFEAKSVWTEPSDDGCVAGVVFAHTEGPTEVAEALGLVESRPSPELIPSRDRTLHVLCGLLVAGSVAAFGYAAYMLA